MSSKLRLICATRESTEGFHNNTGLGRTLKFLSAPFMELLLFERNTAGLPEVYNEAIRRAQSDPAVLVFLHDDLHFLDFFWPMHLMESLRSFEMVGVAGNKRRIPYQSSWLFLDSMGTRDDRQNLSGVVAHGRGFPPDHINAFGPPRMEVKLLDGLFLAVRSETLQSHDLWFDERFDFDFYDMDFCRSAEVKGLRMGTGPISLIHESQGAGCGGARWREAYAKYLEKWGS
jgi:GT2 family glycosyltransferase